MRSKLLAITFLTATFVACRPAVKNAPEPPEKWKKMSHEQRFVYMTDVVEPHMRDVFQAFDAERYADFSCATCHREKGPYEMPNPEIFVIPRSKFREKVYEPHPEEVRFMWEKVEPNMAALLGKRAGFFSFNCRECHTTTKK